MDPNIPAVETNKPIAMSLDELEDLKQRVHDQEVIANELKNRMSAWDGGRRTALWFIAAGQVIMLAALGYLITSISTLSSVSNRQAIELAVTQQKMDNFMSASPRFTSDMAARADFELETKLKEWFLSQAPSQPAQWSKARIEDLESRIKEIERTLRGKN